MTIQKFYRINGGSTQLEGVHSDINLPSRYSYMDIGERDMPNSLKFDKVEPAVYTIWDNYQNYNTVINNSKKRVSANTYFKLIDSNAQWLKSTQDDTTVFLNYDAYTADLEKNKNEASKYNELKDFTTNLTFESPLYEQPLIKADQDLADKREAWHKNLKKDMYIEEALNVLSELKLKSNYHLVKN